MSLRTAATALLVGLGALTAPRLALATAGRNYTLEPTVPETYTPLVGGTDVVFSGANFVSVNLPANSTFRWFGQPVTQVQLSKFGFMSFSRAAVTACASGSCSFPSSLPVPASGPVDSLFMWWTEMTMSTGTVKTGLESVGGRDVFTIDYRNVPTSFFGFPNGQNVSFKVRLYPGGSRIEVVYGQLTNPGAGFGGVLGIQDAATPFRFVLGAPCSSSTCDDSQFPSNRKVTYLYSDQANLRWSDAATSNLIAGANAGDAVSLTVAGTVLNDGFQYAPTFNTRVWLSPTATLSPQAVSLGEGSVDGGLDAGSSAPQSFDVTFARPPATTPRVYLLLHADPPDPIDGGGQVVENDEFDNIRALPLIIGTDLVGEVFAPDSGEAGQPAGVPIRILNQGIDAPSGPFAWQLFVSPDDTLDSTDPQLATGTVQPSELPLQTTVQATLPSNLPSAELFWFLKVDPTSSAQPTGAVAEADETNNTSRSAGSTRVVLPNVAVDGFSVVTLETPAVPVTRAFFGVPVRLRTTVRNLGQAPARDFVVAFYLSGGTGAPVITAFDQELTREVVPLLAPGASLSLEKQVLVPVDSNALDAQNRPIPWTPGNFFFGVIADAEALVGESSETDNIGKVGPVPLRQPAVDFAPIEVSSPTAAEPGEWVPVTAAVRNLGNKGNDAPGAPACSYRYVLSANELFTAEDVALTFRRGGVTGTSVSLALAVGLDARATDLVQIPGDTRAGSYRIGVVVDPDRSCDQIDFSNDTLGSTTPIVISPSGLVITTPSLPDAWTRSSYAVQLGARGVDGSPITWRADAAFPLPAGLTLSTDGLLTGSFATAGLSTLVISAKQGGLETFARWTLQVREAGVPLAILSRTLPPAAGGVPYEAKLLGVGGVPPYTWTRVGGTLPSGLTLSSDGTVRGTPGAATPPTALPLVFQLRDSRGLTDVATVLLRVSGVSSLRLLTEGVPVATVGAAYPPAGGDNAIAAVRGEGPLTFTVIRGALPPGLALGPTETDRVRITGRPTVPGLFPFTLRVSDTAGQADDREFFLMVEPGLLSLTSVPLPNAERGKAYEADLSGLASRGAFTVAAGRLPNGLTLAAEGRLSGTVAADETPGTFAFTVEVRLPTGQIGWVAEAVVVANPVRPIPDDGGCSQAPGGLAPLLSLLLLARRRRAAPLP